MHAIDIGYNLTLSEVNDFSTIIRIMLIQNAKFVLLVDVNGTN